MDMELFGTASHTWHGGCGVPCVPTRLHVTRPCETVQSEHVYCRMHERYTALLCDASHTFHRRVVLQKRHCRHVR